MPPGPAYYRGAAVPYNAGIAFMVTDQFLHYDPPSDSWSAIATGSSSVNFGYYVAAAVVDDKIVTSRGYSGPTHTDKIKVYDPALNKWSFSTAPTNIWDGAATTFRDKVYIFAGRYDATRMEVYSLGDDTTLTPIN